MSEEIRFDGPWPALPYEEWKETYATLHMWTQAVGKVRLVQTLWINHSWHVALYVTARGLTTSPIPHGEKFFQVDFDFVDHRLLLQSTEGASHAFPLEPMAVAEFYAQFMDGLVDIGCPVRIRTTPNEVQDPIPFERDREHRAYDPEWAERFWRALVQIDRVFTAFRAGFIGKCSPVHFFWGAFDMAVTRFSGRPAPEHPGGFPNLPDWVTREAYSHEVSSCGFWPGGGPVPYPVFYAYAYPEPEGFSAAPVLPGAAAYNKDLKEFILPYDAVREADDPDALLSSFLQSSYEAAADLGGWDRSALERKGLPGGR